MPTSPQALCYRQLSLSSVSHLRTSLAVLTQKSKLSVHNSAILNQIRAEEILSYSTIKRAHGNFKKLWGNEAMPRISVLWDKILAHFSSCRVVPYDGDIMSFLPLPVLAWPHSTVCLCFLQPFSVPCWRVVMGAKRLFTWGDNTPSNWLIHWEQGLPLPSFSPVDCSLASHAHYHRWQMSTSSGRQPDYPVVACGTWRCCQNKVCIRAQHTETGLCQQSCKLYTSRNKGTHPIAIKQSRHDKVIKTTFDFTPKW